MLGTMVGFDSGRLSQTFLTVLYSTCIIGMFFTVVLIWKARYMINTSYAQAHSHFTQAATDKCLIDAGWSNVLTLWNTHTSFTNMAGTLLYMLYLFVTMLLVGVVFAIWALMGLADAA